MLEPPCAAAQRLSSLVYRDGNGSLGKRDRGCHPGVAAADHGYLHALRSRVSGSKSQNPERGNRRYAVTASPAAARWPFHTFPGTNTKPSNIRRAVRTSAARRNSCLPFVKSTSRSMTIIPWGCSMRTIPWGAGGKGEIFAATVPGMAHAEAMHTVPVTGCALWHVSGTKKRDAMVPPLRG